MASPGPWRWLVRFGVLGMLVILGVILWQLVPPQPRCQITTKADLVNVYWHLSGDGGKLFLAVEDPASHSEVLDDGREVVQGADPYIEVWDVFSRQLLQKLPMKAEIWAKQKVPNFDPAPWEHYLVSTDDRYLLYWQDNRHTIYDLLEDRQLPVAEQPSDRFFLSYSGQKYFCLSDDQETLVVEWATGQVLKTYPLGRERPFMKGQWAPLSPNEEYFLADNFPKGLITVDPLTSARTPLQLPREKGWYYFSPGGGYLIYYNEDHHLHRAWNLQTGRKTVELFGVRGSVLGNLDVQELEGIFVISPDDKFFLCRQEEGGAELGELASGKILSSLSLKEASLSPLDRFCFSPDCRYLAAAIEEYEEFPDNSNKVAAHLLMFAVPSGRQLWHQPPLGPRSYFVNEMVFLEGPQELLVVWESVFGLHSLKSHDTASGRQRLEVTKFPIPVGLTRGAQKMIVFADDPGPWEEKVRKWLGFPWLGQTLEIVDLAAGRNQGKMKIGEKTFGWLSRDGNSLMVFDRGMRICLFYDVPLRPPLAWVLGPPLALGLLFLALLYWLRRRQSCTL